MRINPTVLVGGIVVVFFATMIGIVYAHDIQGTMAVIAFGTMLIMQFIGILKLDRDKEEVKKEAVQAAAEVKEDNRKNVREVKDATDQQTQELKTDQRRAVLQVASVARAVDSDKMDTVVKKLEVVEKQTNGDITKRFEAMEGSIQKLRDDLPALIRDAIQGSAHVGT